MTMENISKLNGKPFVCSDFKSEFLNAKVAVRFPKLFFKKKVHPSFFHVVTVNTQGLLHMLNQCTVYKILRKSMI